MNSLFIKALFLWMALFAAHAHAAFGFKLDGTLDKAAISHAYFEGEFSRILPPLETYRQSFPTTATKEDSIFVYKYLSVIYAADPSTRKKAESYMIQLVKLMPTIELLDLYISDNIESIFRNVKTNFLQQQKYVREHDEYGRVTAKDSVPKTTPPKIGDKHGSHEWAWWTAAGVGVAASTGVVIYFVNQSGSSHDSYRIRP